MRDPARKVGIGRWVRLAWLEETASLILAGNDKDAVEGALDRMLRPEISAGGNAPRSGRAKAITVLLKTWLLVPTGLEPLRDDGLDLMRDTHPSSRIALHWGMLLAAYPFWGAVAAHAGRQLRLERFTTAAAVQQRIREEYGDRPSVERAARYVLRSFVDWGVLRESERAGVYAAAPGHALNEPKLLAWLAEAVLRSRRIRAGAPMALLAGPRLFPFCAVFSSAEAIVAQNARLDFVRHGLDEELVMLRRDTVTTRSRPEPPRLAFVREPAARRERG